MKTTVREFQTKAEVEAFTIGFSFGRNSANDMRIVGDLKVEIADADDPACANYADVMACYGEDAVDCMDLHLPMSMAPALVLKRGDAPEEIRELNEIEDSETGLVLGVQFSNDHGFSKTIRFPVADWFKALEAVRTELYEMGK